MRLRPGSSAIPDRHPAKDAEMFNKLFPIGTEVRYWRMARTGPPSGTGKTVSPAQVLGGHSAVVWITGCSGAIALTHVEVVR